MSPITPLLIAEMSDHLPSLQMIPINNYSSDIWIDKDLARKLDLQIQVKSAVAKALRESDLFASNDFKQFELLFDPLSQLDNDIQESFNVFRNPSEIEEFFQCPRVHFQVAEKSASNFQMFETILNAESTSSLFKFGAKTTSLSSCPRCRLLRSKVENELCSRCSCVI